MARDFSAGEKPAFGYHRVILNGEDPSEIPDPAAFRQRAYSEPYVEVHYLGIEVNVITEIPGANPESIRLSFQYPAITIEADSGEQSYHTTATLPPVNPGSMHTSFKNGVLK
jgi:HSP20 family molecular chaperone IbpA